VHGAHGLDNRRSREEKEPTLAEITTRVRGLLGRFGKRRAERKSESSERALKQQAAKAQRLSHERMDNKLPR